MTTDRHQRIIGMLRERSTVRCRELQNLFSVTAMTVWRDLRELEELGLLQRIRGGAQAVITPGDELEFEMKTIACSEVKQRIAEYAVACFIRDGETVALEGGTTVAALVDHLPEARIAILTNSLPIALRVRSRRPNLPVKLAGGWLSQISGNVVGPETLQFIEKQRASICFLSATGFDAELGPTDPNPLEIEVKRAWAKVSERVVLLLDSSKLGVRSAAVMLHPRRLHAVVTDAPPPAEIAKRLAENGVELMIAE